MKGLTQSLYFQWSKFVYAGLGILLANPNNRLESVGLGIFAVWSILIVIQVIACGVQVLAQRQFLSKGKDLINELDWIRLDAIYTIEQEGMNWGQVLLVLLSVYAIDYAGHFEFAVVYFLIQSVHLIMVYTYVESRRQIAKMAKNRVISLNLANNTDK